MWTIIVERWTRNDERLIPTKARWILLMILVASLIAVGCAVAGWEDARLAKPVQDLREYLLPVPDATKFAYGNSDRTQVMYNLIKFKEELLQLRKEVDELKKAGEAAEQPSNEAAERTVAPPVDEQPPEVSIKAPGHNL